MTRKWNAFLNINREHYRKDAEISDIYLSIQKICSYGASTSETRKLYKKNKLDIVLNVDKIIYTLQKLYTIRNLKNRFFFNLIGTPCTRLILESGNRIFFYHNNYHLSPHVDTISDINILLHKPHFQYQNTI